MEAWIAQHFLNPAYVLAGAALIASPIIIHLINRMRFKRVRFAAMEFLLVSQRRNRRRILMEQLLLLLLRVLAVLCLVGLIARLVLDPNELKLFQGARSHHVVLLDDSGSMRDLARDGTAFQEGLEVIRRLVGEGTRRPGTQKFTLVLLSAPDKPLFTQREIDEDFLIELDTRLRGLSCSHQALSLPPGMEGARNVLLEDRAAVRHLHLVSDFREGDWQDQQALARMVRELDQAGVTLNCVRTQGRRNPNLGVIALNGDVQVASVGVPVRLTVSVQNFGEQVASNVALSILQDGQKLPLAVTFDRVEAGVEVKQDFDLTFTSAGRHRVDVMLPPDPLIADNTRYLALDVSATNRVLIVEGNPAGDEGEYLADALAADPGITGYSPLIESVDYLRRRSLDEFQSIFMLNVAELPADALAPLEEFVRQGGGLAWFLGNQVRPGYYLSELYRDGQGLFPVKPGVVSLKKQSSAVAEAGPDMQFVEHPVLQVFAGQDNPFTGLIRVFEFFPVSEDWERDDQKRGDGVKTIASLTTREPLLLESRFGAGRVMTFMTSCGPVWNNWARYPSYVAMMLDLEKYIAKRDRVLEQRLSGQPIELQLNPAEFTDEIEIIGPDLTGNRITRQKAAPVKPASTSGATPVPASGTGTETTSAASVLLASTFRDTDAPGIYRVRLTDQSQNPVERWITYNVPVEESALALAPADLIRKQLGSDIDITIQEPGEFSWIAGRDAGQEVRQWLLGFLILLLLLEQFMSYRLSYHTQQQT